MQWGSHVLIYVFSEFYLIEPQSQDFVQMYVARLWENPLNCSWNNSSRQNNSSRVSARFYVVVKKSFTVASLSVTPLGLSVRVSRNKCVLFLFAFWAIVAKICNYKHFMLFTSHDLWRDWFLRTIKSNNFLAVFWTLYKGLLVKYISSFVLSEKGCEWEFRRCICAISSDCFESFSLGWPRNYLIEKVKQPWWICSIFCRCRPKSSVEDGYSDGEEDFYFNEIDLEEDDDVFPAPLALSPTPTQSHFDMVKSPWLEPGVITSPTFGSLQHPRFNWDVQALSRLPPTPPASKVSGKTSPPARIQTHASHHVVRKVRGESKKCRKVYGMENRHLWCTQCRWKKACVRFADWTFQPANEIKNISFTHLANVIFISMIACSY